MDPDRQKVWTDRRMEGMDAAKTISLRLRRGIITCILLISLWLTNPLRYHLPEPIVDHLCVKGKSQIALFTKHAVTVTLRWQDSKEVHC